MSDAKRGGARPGAGRPKGETTTMVRVPDGCLEQVRQLISAYRNHEVLPSTSMPDPAPVVADKLPGAQKAWDVYAALFSSRPGWELLYERYFMLTSETDYPFIFLVHLLDRLLELHDIEAQLPIQWTNIRELRQFAKELYVHNGHLK